MGDALVSRFILIEASKKKIGRDPLRVILRHGGVSVQPKSVSALDAVSMYRGAYIGKLTDAGYDLGVLDATIVAVNLV